MSPSIDDVITYIYIHQYNGSIYGVIMGHAYHAYMYILMPIFKYLKYNSEKKNSYCLTAVIINHDYYYTDKNFL